MEILNHYLTYDDYKQIGGTLKESIFRIKEYKAEVEINKYTQGRFKEEKEFPNELKLCVFDLISMLNQEESSNIVSESVGEVSRTFKNQTKEEKEKDIKSTIISYLSEVKIDNIPVLYCGADICKRT